MTREEAREILTHNWTRVDNPNYSESELDEAFFMAIEALQTDSVSREAHYDAVANRITDMEERGFVSVVRCKDCRYFKKIAERSDSGLCHRDIVASAWKENGYCSRGERRK